MKILIVSQVANNAEVKNVNVIPRIGDSIDMFYYPFPIVTKVILFPTSNLLQKFDQNNQIMAKLDHMYIDAIVCVDWKK